ncbi:hypothetical protein [Halorussus amylolyticus]|uniref:hypothetical protein n=1 Tax=Halorussus amylolyticus TaxID=1126242 RepID=UPI00138F4BD1|nr:hypothetical protein [Halorussus amylolyticus]
MSERPLPTDRIERRTVLSALGAGLGGAGLSRHVLARESADATHVVEQGDRCVPITPLSGDETVEEFYDYRTPFTDPSGPAYSSYGTTDLQRAETSICFLYDGPEGLSLVVIHDALDDGTSGGSVTFQFENLAGGEWAVGDDVYDGESNYDRFEETADGWQIDWTWTEGRSDGGAYRPLGDDFAVTIHPAFNEEAALYGDPYEGELTDWQVVSGDRNDPDRISLSLTDSVTIRPGDCSGSGTTTTVGETTRETTPDGKDEKADDGHSDRDDDDREDDDRDDESDEIEDDDRADDGGSDEDNDEDHESDDRGGDDEENEEDEDEDGDGDDDEENEEDEDEDGDGDDDEEEDGDDEGEDDDDDDENEDGEKAPGKSGEKGAGRGGRGDEKGRGNGGDRGRGNGRD